MSGDGLTCDTSVVPARCNVDEFASDGECLLYSSIHDQATALNRSATEIWGLCDGSRSIGAIARVLAERYELDERLFYNDIAAAVAMFRERGLVEVAGAAPPLT